MSEQPRILLDTKPLDAHEKMKLARGILDRTACESGAGFVLIMWVPGSDQIYRAYRGVDSVEECILLSGDVAGLLAKRAEELKANQPKPLHNDTD